VIDFPAGILKKQLDKYFVRGAILRTEIEFPGVERFKRLYLLNRDFQSDPILYVLSTSQLGFFRRHQKEPSVTENCIFLDAGRTSSNKSEPCVIDLRRVSEIDKEKLLEKFRTGKLAYLGKLPEDIISEIDEKIRASRLIDPFTKKRILP
jgi:hypothetical protein